jgi:4'-phosphopantetheinyl transferase
MSAGLIAAHTAQPTAVSTLTDRNAVYISWVNLDQSDADIASAVSDLSPDEQERADRYHRLVHRNRFIAARSCLRRMIGSFLHVAAEEIMFVAGTHGKPALSDRFSFQDLRFNLAHSEEMAVLAIAFGRDVGVDVEHVRPNVQFLEIARRMFAPGEYVHLETLTEDEIMRAFYRCWTRKEAYVKATGAGLSLALDSFEVPVSPQRAPFRVTLHDACLPTGTLTDISPNDDFAAALAILGSEEPLPVLIHNPG